MITQEQIELWAKDYENIKHMVTDPTDVRWCAFVAGAHAVNKEASERIAKLETALKKLGPGWLYWPAKRQPDPRVVMYESRTIDEVEKMANEALVDPNKDPIKV
jgi:hypothetical protein